MNKDLLDWGEEAYQSYITNFVEPICPPELDVQPEFYLPLEKEKFLEIILHNTFRSKEIAERWGVVVSRQELTLNERKKMYEDIHIPGFQVEENVWLDSKLRAHNIPKYRVTLTHNNKSIEIYE